MGKGKRGRKRCPRLRQATWRPWQRRSISLRRESRMDSDALVPPHNAPYTRQFMRRTVLNTFAAPHHAPDLSNDQLQRSLYIKANILNVVHLHCKYGGFLRSFSKNRAARDVQTARIHAFVSLLRPLCSSFHLISRYSSIFPSNMLLRIPNSHEFLATRYSIYFLPLVC